jgi:hypothetical protein
MFKHGKDENYLAATTALSSTHTSPSDAFASGGLLLKDKI